MPDLTPIPTAYNGHLFRSRLEARWAVFFDALGVRYEYEAEGYELADRWYLPDFWLPDLNCYAEIKPTPAGGFAEGQGLFNETAQMLANDANRLVMVIYGNPWPDSYEVMPHQRKRFHFTEEWLFAVGRKHPEELWLFSKSGAFCLNPNAEGHDFPELRESRVNDAYLAARSARFEHGESGRTL